MLYNMYKLTLKQQIELRVTWSSKRRFNELNLLCKQNLELTPLSSRGVKRFLTLHLQAISRLKLSLKCSEYKGC